MCASENATRKEKEGKGEVRPRKEKRKGILKCRLKSSLFVSPVERGGGRGEERRQIQCERVEGEGRGAR